MCLYALAKIIREKQPNDSSKVNRTMFAITEKALSTTIRNYTTIPHCIGFPET